MNQRKEVQTPAVSQYPIVASRRISSITDNRYTVVGSWVTSIVVINSTWILKEILKDIWRKTKLESSNWKTYNGFLLLIRTVNGPNFTNNILSVSSDAFSKVQKLVMGLWGVYDLQGALVPKYWYSLVNARPVSIANL